MSENVYAPTLEELLAEALAAEATGIDMSTPSVGGGGARLLPEGYAFARLVKYTEMGVQPQTYNGKPKDPCLEFCLEFELSGTSPSGEKWNNEDGTPYLFRTWNFREGNNEKSGTYKLFKKMNWEGTAKSFAALLGKAFLIPFRHEEVAAKEGKPAHKRSVAGFDNILPPFDAVSRAPYPVPEADPKNFGLFFYRTPKKAAWDKLHIAGTNDTTGKSKNWIQEKILSSVDYIGSPLQMLLEGAVGMPSLVAEALPTAPAAVPVIAPVVAPVVAQAVPVVPNVPAVAPSVTPVSVAALPVVASAPAAAVPSVPSMPALPVLPTI